MIRHIKFELIRIRVKFDEQEHEESNFSNIGGNGTTEPQTSFEYHQKWEERRRRRGKWSHNKEVTNR